MNSTSIDTGARSRMATDPVALDGDMRSSSNRRIETDRRQRRFATLAPSAHAGR